MPTNPKNGDTVKKHPNVIARETPNGYDAECALLASILLDGATALNYMPGLSERDFYTPAHKSIFEGIVSIFERAGAIDLVTVSAELEKRGTLALCGGVEYLSKLIDALPSVANAEYYYNAVKKYTRLREVIKIAQQMADEAYALDPNDNAIRSAESKLYDLSENDERGKPEIVGNFARIALADLQQRAKDPKSTKCVPTGFTRLNTVLGGGFHPGDLIILAARPGQGKTSFAMNCAVNAALTTKHKSSEKFRVAVFSLEMTAVQLTNRILCSLANYDMSMFNRAIVNEHDWDKLYSAEKKLSGMSLYIDQTGGITPAEIVSKCRALKRGGGLDFVMIDYLQLVRSGKRTDNFVREIAEITWALKNAAKELNVPILLLSQMSRSIEQRGPKDKDVRLSDLRDSGAIEQDADIVMFIEKKEVKAGEAKPSETRGAPSEVFLNIAKHRNGETGSIKLIWHPSTVTFTDVHEAPDDSGANNRSGAKAYGFDDEPPLPDEPPSAGAPNTDGYVDPGDSGLM